MSKRAEKAAWDWAVENKLDPYSMGQAYAEGFKKGENEMIERAARWIMNPDNQAKARFRITDKEFIGQFRKEMEEE